MQEVGAKSKSAQLKMMKTDPPPRMPAVLNYYVDAFFVLSTERHYVNGAMLAIPVTKIIEYASWLNENYVDRFIKMIQALDLAYITYYQDRVESQRKLAEMNSKRKQN